MTFASEAKVVWRHFFRSASREWVCHMTRAPRSHSSAEYSTMSRAVPAWCTSVDSIMHAAVQPTRVSISSAFSLLLPFSSQLAPSGKSSIDLGLAGSAASGFGARRGSFTSRAAQLASAIARTRRACLIAPSSTLLAVLATLLVGCAAHVEIPSDATHRAEGARLVETAVQSHGGMEAWPAIGGVRLHLHTEGTMSVYPPETDWLLDPARNRGIMRWREPGRAIEVRYDGRSAVIVENGRCIESEQRRTMGASRISNILFWFGVPWKFRDAGAIVSSAPPHPLASGAAPAPRFYVAYTLGETPKDWFLVSLDPNTARIARVEYVASELSRMLVLDGRWERYTEIEGLTLATRRVHRPRNPLLRALSRPFVQELSEIAVHQPLDDRDFKAPKSCTDPPPASPTHVELAIDVSTEIIIERSAAEVARVFADPSMLPRWLGEETEIAWDGVPAFEPGARFTFHAKFHGRTLTYHYEIVEHVPARDFVLKTVDGAPLVTRAAWTQLAPNRTRMHVRTTGRLEVPMLVAPLIPPSLRREINVSLGRLKGLVEQAP